MRNSEIEPSVLCVDIGGTSTKVGIFEPSQQLRMITTIPTREPVDEYADKLCGAVRIALREAGNANLRVAGIGLAGAGFVDQARDRLVYCSNIAWLENYPLRDRLVSEFSTRVEIDVDSNAAALAEYHLGVGRGSQRFFCVVVGTGLGAAMLINGEPLRFAYGCLGDPGHIVVQADGPPCPCGGRGCVEILVSSNYLAEQYGSSTATKNMSLRNVIEDARAGNFAAVEILKTAGMWLGIATASLTNILVPDRIAIAGGLAEAGDLLMPTVERYFREHVSAFIGNGVTLMRASLGAMATLTGAAYLILDRIEVPAGHHRGQ